MFSRKPMYQNLAEKRQKYWGRRDEQLASLAEMKEQGVPVIKLGDEHSKDRLIEETFMKCMWEVEG